MSRLKNCADLKNFLNGQRSTKRARRCKAGEEKKKKEKRRQSLFVTGGTGVGKKHFVCSFLRKHGIAFWALHADKIKDWSFLENGKPKVGQRLRQTTLFQKSKPPNVVAINISSAVVSELSKIFSHLKKSACYIIFIRANDGKPDAVHKKLVGHCSKTLWIYPLYVKEVQDILQKHLNHRVSLQVAESFNGNIIKAITTLKFTYATNTRHSFTTKKQLEKVFAGGVMCENVNKTCPQRQMQQHILQNLVNIQNIRDVCKMYDMLTDRQSVDQPLDLNTSASSYIAHVQRANNRKFKRACAKCGGELGIRVSKKRELYRKCIACGCVNFDQIQLNWDLNSEQAEETLRRETKISTFTPTPLQLNGSKQCEGMFRILNPQQPGWKRVEVTESGYMRVTQN